MFRAVTTTAILQYRMMTAADPFFEARPLSLNANYDDVETIKHVWLTQIKYSKYRANLLRAAHFRPLFGSVICQEDYREIGVSHFGRRIPVTTLTPRVMDQVMFDRAATSFDEADWVATADVTSKHELRRLAQEAKDLGAPWNAKALEAAANDEENNNTINFRVLERIRRSGFSIDDAFAKKKEIVMYYGKLDCLSDGIEYVAALINRKYLVRFHANNFQHGKRGFRLSKWIDFDHPLGYGLGQLLGGQHKSMDANRQKAQDMASFNAYGMTKRRKNSVSDEDLVIAPLQIIDVDNMDDLMPYQTGNSGQEGIMALDEVLKQEFRVAANASDTMQAIATDATATGAALAQDAAMRANSVMAETAADSLVREHLEVNHANNCQNIRAPFNINKAGITKRVYPAQMMIDLEIEAKCSTDKDFQPKRLEKLIQTLQVLTSTKSNHPDQMQISILPLVKGIASMLDVNPNEVIMQPGPMGMPAMPGLSAGDMLGMGGQTAPVAGGGLGPVPTPVGPVLSA